MIKHLIFKILKNQNQKKLKSLVSQKSMKLNNGVIFLWAEVSSFDVRFEIVNPPQSATLSTSLKTYI